MTDAFKVEMGQALMDEYNRHMDKYVDELIYGAGTGEPKGILNAAGQKISITSPEITWEDIENMHRRLTPTEEAP